MKNGRLPRAACLNRNFNFEAMIVEVILAILAAAVQFIPHMLDRIDKWSYRRKFIQQNQEYIKQVEEADAKYHPERPDVELAQKCKEYLSEVFPYGVESKTQNMSQEELIEFFRQLEKGAEQIMGVNVNANFYAAPDQPAINKTCGFYHHETNTLHINAAFILSGDSKLVEEQVYTIFHELKHARQWAAIEGYLYSTHDFGYSEQQIREWATNFDHYIPNFVDDEWYQKQPLENDAFGFESILKGERQFEVIG